MWALDPARYIKEVIPQSQSLIQSHPCVSVFMCFLILIKVKLTYWEVGLSAWAYHKDYSDRQYGETAFDGSLP